MAAQIELPIRTPEHIAEGTYDLEVAVDLGGQIRQYDRTSSVGRGPNRLTVRYEPRVWPKAPAPPDHDCKGEPLVGHANPPQADGVAPVSPLDAAAREVLKGTLVPLKAAVSGGDAHGLVKYGTVRQLQLAQGETDAVREHLQLASRLAGNESDAHGSRVSAATLDLFRSFEQPLVSALRPRITAVAAVPVHEIASFANALAEVRAYQTRAAQESQLPPEALGGLTRSLNGAVVAARSFAINTAAQPLGMLNLERIEMVPTGIQRGELVATIPLAPGEETAVTHKEWSVTSKEFTTIVTDSLENTS
jgi:hypothetical protein